jgi:FkbM family methyltransferase
MRLGKYSFTNLWEFLHIYLTVFLLGEYKFTSGKRNPVIIDGGAHIGISAIFFKKLYPDAKVIAIEPDPRNIKLLEANIMRQNLSGIILEQSVLSHKNVPVNLYRYSWSWSNSIVKEIGIDKDRVMDAITVPSILLSHLINQEIALLKLDIEGAEYEVLNEAKDKLSLVNEIIIEFHKSPGNPDNNLQKTINLIAAAGYSTLEINRSFRCGRKVDLKNIDKLPPCCQLIIHARR